MNQKISFLQSVKNMFVGVARPAAYLRNGVYGRMSHALLMVFLVNVLLYLVIFFIPYNQLFGGGRLADTVDDAVGDFVLTEDGFSYDDVYEYSDEEGLSYIRIDTSEETCDTSEAGTLASENGYSTVVLVSSQEIMAYSSGSASTIKCRDVYGVLNEARAQTSFSKQDILDVIEKWDTPVLVIAYILEIIAGMAGTLLWSLVIAAIGLASASSKKKNMTLGNALKASIYIRLLWYSVLMIIGTYLVPAKTFLGVVSLIISAVYICRAVKKFEPDEPELLQDELSAEPEPALTCEQPIGGYGDDGTPQ